MSLGESIFNQSFSYASSQEWAKGYEGTISKIPREGFVKAELSDLDNNPDGPYWVDRNLLSEILAIENLKDKRSSGGVFYSHDEL